MVNSLCSPVIILPRCVNSNCVVVRDIKRTQLVSPSCNPGVLCLPGSEHCSFLNLQPRDLTQTSRIVSLGLRQEGSCNCSTFGILRRL